MRRTFLATALVLAAIAASCVPRDCTGFKIDPASQPAQQELTPTNPDH